MISIELPLKPVSVNQAFRAIPRGKYCTNIKSAQYRQFEKDALTLLPKKEMITGEVEVTIEFYLKSRFTISDVDNYAKATLDIIAKAGYFENDNKITALHLHKYKADDWNIKIVITQI